MLIGDKRPFLLLNISDKMLFQLFLLLDAQQRHLKVVV